MWKVYYYWHNTETRLVREVFGSEFDAVCYATRLANYGWKTFVRKA